MIEPQVAAWRLESVLSYVEQMELISGIIKARTIRRCGARAASISRRAAKKFQNVGLVDGLYNPTEVVQTKFDRCTWW